MPALPTTGVAHIGRVPRNPFIEPSAPVLRSEPPNGPAWLHEVKHDGWRAQMHLSGGIATISGKNGGDLNEISGFANNAYRT